MVTHAEGDVEAPELAAPRLKVAILAEDRLTCQALAAALGARARAHPYTRYADLRAGLERRAVDVVLWFAHAVDGLTFGRVATLCRDHSLPLCLLTAWMDSDAAHDACFGRGGEVLVLPRHSQPDTAKLFDTLAGLASGETPERPRCLEDLLADAQNEPDALAPLTESELRVLEMVALGLRNRAIARRMRRSEKLIEKRLGRIFAKLGLREGDCPDLDRRVTAARTFIERQRANAIVQESVGGSFPSLRDGGVPPGPEWDPLPPASAGGDGCQPQAAMPALGDTDD